MGLWIVATTGLALPRTNVFTISAWNNWGVAYNFFESVQHHMPHTTRTWFIADDAAHGDARVATIRNEVKTNGKINILTIDDISSSMKFNPYELAFRYDMVCFNTAIKPHVFKFLFSDGYDQVLYFDPDVVLFSPLSRIVELLNTRTFVLTPHITVPIPDDGLWQSDLQIMRTGLFNYGFIGMSMSNSERLFEHLNWWGERLRYYGYVDLERGMHFDQNWGIFITVFENKRDYEILREPEYNVAYWNLHYTGRWIHKNASGVYFNTTRHLGFYHFSGISTNAFENSRISPHQTRFKLHDFPNLKGIYDDYTMNVSERKSKYFDVPYNYGKFANGLPIPTWLRQLVKPATERSVHPTRDVLRDALLTLIQTSQFRVEHMWAWLWEHRCDHMIDAQIYNSWVPNIMFILWRMVEYTIPVQIYKAYTWFSTFGIFTWSLLGMGDAATYIIRRSIDGHYQPRSFCYASKKINVDVCNDQQYLDTSRILKRTFDSHQMDSMRTKGGALLDHGVNLIGYHNGIFGVAESSRSIHTSLTHAQIPTVLVNLPTTGVHTFFQSGLNFTRTWKYKTNIVVLNADMTVSLGDVLPSNIWRNYYNIAVWAWELSSFPKEWVSYAYTYDAIIVSSDFQRNSILAALAGDAITRAIPVTTVPFGVEPRQTSKLSPYAELTKGRFVFLLTFDFFSVLERKNPFAAIKAFQASFGRGRVDVVMIIKYINADDKDEMSLRDTVGDFKNILLIDRHLTADEHVALKVLADCHVSTHRSEGFGLNIAESIMMKKPIIATLYGGNMEYMQHIPNEILSKLGVQYDIVTLEHNIGKVYKAGSVWAEPRHEDIQRAMSYAHEHPVEIKQDAEHIYDVVSQLLSYDHVGAKLGAYLSKIIFPTSDTNELIDPMLCYFLANPDLVNAVLSRKSVLHHFKTRAKLENRITRCGMISQSTFALGERLMLTNSPT